MKKRTTSSDRSGNPAGRALYVALAGALLLSGAWGTASTAMAATCADDDCANVVRGLQAHIFAVSGLTVRVVDLGSAETGDERIASGISPESAPLLFLTPRVASILEDVFAESLDPALSAAVEQDKDEESAVAVSEKNDLSTSPVAEVQNRNTASDPYGPLTVLDDDAELPRFQRQMYRTDI